ncbi:MAG: hypothetical protein ACK559_01650, partial [bacterium]
MPALSRAEERSGDRSRLLPEATLEGGVLHLGNVPARHGVSSGERLRLGLEGLDVGVALEGREEVLEGLARLLLDLDADLHALVHQVRHLDEVLLGEAA